MEDDFLKEPFDSHKKLLFLFQTIKGERWLDMDYGSDLYKDLFNSITHSAGLKRKVLKTILQHEPKCKINGVELTQVEQGIWEVNIQLIEDGNNQVKELKWVI